MSLYNKVIDLQKLGAAWDKVRKNKPACGVDNVTYEQFDANKRQELKQLHVELQEHTYQTLPVKKIVLYKGEKAREIALYAMRDKVVQQSIAEELNKLYDSKFSSQTYAYRHHKSALDAVDEATAQMKSGAWQAVLKLDIVHFFDQIQWPILQKILKEEIQEPDLIQLIENNLEASALGDGGALQEKKIGIYQGSGISPILSNVYLMDFDQWLAKQDVYFVRYSDDILVAGRDKESLARVLTQIRVLLESRGLVLNDEKMVCADIAEGIDFLGYHISSTGKTIPSKAEQNLRERLEWIWLTSVQMGFEAKLEKIIEVIGGWEQYFREERKDFSIFEYIALASMRGCSPEHLETLKKQRFLVDNVYRDIMQYLADMWQQAGEPAMELLEYEQYYQIWEQEAMPPDDTQRLILNHYRKLVVKEDKDAMLELMQLYSDIGQYRKAAFWMKKSEEARSVSKQEISCTIPSHSEDTGQDIAYDQTTAQRILKSLVGREDVYGIETYGHGGKRQTDVQMSPVAEQKILKHLSGEITIVTYVQRPNSTVKYMVVDIDVSRGIALKHDRKSVEFQAYLEKSHGKAQEVAKLLQRFDMQGYVEDSGCRGYHVWIFFTEWIPVRYVNLFSDFLRDKIDNEEGINLEFFPNKTRMKPGKFGQAIKLPYGIHLKSGKQSYFLDENGKKVLELNQFLDSIAKTSLKTIKRILAANTDSKENLEAKIVDTNLEAFGGASINALEVLKNCNLMRYLSQKAVKTGYLTHFERLSMLYVFGHLGEEGKAFVHQVMAFTLNYQYNVTEKFIRKMPEKPISCIKLRDQYKSVTAEFGCNCNFKRTRNCYPSPVMHAISLSNDLQGDITLPTSRSISKEKQEKVIDEINVHKKAQALARRILDLKKQRRGLDSAISKVEDELEAIYDDAHVDSLEIEMGILVRRKNESGYEWLIEI